MSTFTNSDLTLAAIPRGPASPSTRQTGLDIGEFSIGPGLRFGLCLLNAGRDIMFLGFLHDIIDEVSANTRTENPVEETPGPEVSLPTAQHVVVRAACNAPEDEVGRHRRVAGVRERLFQRDER